MVDLKCFDPDVHQTHDRLAQRTVLDTIRLLADHDRLHEVRLLLVPGSTTTKACSQRTAGGSTDVDPAMRVKVIGFRYHGVRPSADPFAGAHPESARVLR